MRPDLVTHRSFVLLTAVALAGCSVDADLAEEAPAPSIHALGVDAGAGAKSAWMPARPMIQPRKAHTATLLHSGKVLVTGGIYDTFLAMDSAEEYDPDSNTWASVGSMQTPRSHHTATLLPDGRVLVAGGYLGDLSINSESAPTSSAEIYDPTSRKFTPVKPMSTPRGFLTATLLNDGRVLATGGISFVSSTVTKAIATAEVYDPAMNTWTFVGPMLHARAAHAAVLLLDGSVLVAGGYDGSDELTTERFVPDMGGFTPAAEMAMPRERFDAALLLDGRVLVSGVVPTPEIYDPSQDQWSPTAPMATPTNGPPTRLLNGRILSAGGFRGGDPLRSAEVFDPVGNAWFSVSSMADGRMEHTVTLLLDGRVLVAGGDTNAGKSALGSAELLGAKLGGEACGEAGECQSGSCVAGVCTCGSVHDCAAGLACDLSHTCGPPEEDPTGASGCAAAKAVGNGADEWAVLGLALIAAIMGARGRRASS